MLFKPLNTLHIHIPKTGGTTISANLLRVLEPKRWNRLKGRIILDALMNQKYSPVDKKIEKAHIEASEYKKVLGEDYDKLWKFAILRNPFSQIRSLFNQLTLMNLEVNERFKPYKTMNFQEFILGRGECSLEGNRSLIDQKKYVTDEKGNIIVDKLYIFEEYSKAIEDISKKTGVKIESDKKWRETTPEQRYTPKMIDRVMDLYGETYEFYKYVKNNVLS